MERAQTHIIIIINLFLKSTFLNDGSHPKFEYGLDM